MRLGLPDPISFGSEVENEAIGPARSVGSAFMVGGLLGAVMSVQEPGLSAAERAVAGTASIATVALGGLLATEPRPVMVLLRKRPQRSAAAFYATAASSCALGGGHRTPAYFPAILLTAVGAGIAADGVGGVAAGGAVALGYLVGCGWTLRVLHQRPTREAWWNPAAALAFVTAGRVGGIVGELSLNARSLGDFLERDRNAHERGSTDDLVARDIETVRQHADRFLEALPRVEHWFDEDDEVVEVTSRIATALATLKTASLRLPGPVASEEPLDLWPRLQEVARWHNDRPGDVNVTLVSLDPVPPLADEVTTNTLITAAVALVQNSANARDGRPQPVETEIRIGTRVDREGTWLQMIVEDDAGGGEVPRERWGEGLTDSNDGADRLGGWFTTERGAAGTRAVMTVPRVGDRRLGTRATTLTQRFERERDDVIGRLRRTTALQGFFLVLASRPVNTVAPALLRWAAVVGVSEVVVERLDGRRRAAAEAALAMGGMAAFPGPVHPPLGGWAATMCASAGARQHRGWSAVGALAATAAALLVAGPKRFGEDLPVTLGDRLFALIGLGGGIGVGRGIKHVADQERRISDEARQRTLLEDVVAPARDRHHFLEPLEEALGPDRWRAFSESPLGREVDGLEGPEFHEAQARLVDRLLIDDPVVALQRQLARLLAPATVSVEGARPNVLAFGTKSRLEAIRHRLGLIGVGLATAQQVRASMPTRMLRRVSPRSVTLRISTPKDGSLTRIEVVPVPFGGPAPDGLSPELDGAARRAGGRAGAATSDGFDIYVHPSALS